MYFLRKVYIENIWMNMQTRKFEGNYYKTQQPNVIEVDICATQNVSGKEGKKDKGIKVEFRKQEGRGRLSHHRFIRQGRRKDFL